MIKDKMYGLHGTSAPRATESINHVLNSNIMEVEITLYSIQEEGYTSCVEYHNQKHIYR